MYLWREMPMVRFASLARTVLVLAALPLADVACSSSESSPLDDVNGSRTTKPSAGDQALGEPGGPVTDVRAEATAVAHHLAEGNLDLAAARASFTGRITAVDFDGTPSFYLVFTSTDPGIASPLAYAADRGPALLEASSATSSVVGASEERPEIAVSESGLSLLFEITETGIAMGGIDKLTRLVAPLPGVLLAVDREGTYWEVKTRTPLAADTLEARKKELAEVIAAERDEAAAIAREGWATRRDGSGAPDVSLDAVKTPRGNLDLARAIDLTVASVPSDTLRLATRTAAQEELEAATSGRQGLWNSSTENCKTWWFFGWHSSCDHVEVGEIGEPAKNQAHMPWQGRGHAMKKCVQFQDPDDNAFLGCGPAAFTTLVWAEWKGGGAFSSLADLDRNAISPYLSIDANYKKFSNTFSASLIESMGTCSFGDDGAMTTPGGLRKGAEAWLTANGSSKRFKMLGGVLGLGTGLDDVATALHDRIGLRSQPTVAGFDLGFASSHWSPIYKYRIVRPAGMGRLQVYIQSLDWKDRWYSLGGIKLLSALAWLE